MNSDKQIDEMAKDLCHTDTCEIKKIGIPCNHRCKAHIYATRAIDKGYRKASEVALEVIGEINDNFDQMVNETENTIMNAIQEGNLTAARIARYGKDVIILARNTLTKMLEKKYTEGEG